jgi:hypothetical protein
MTELMAALQHSVLAAHLHRAGRRSARHSRSGMCTCGHVFARPLAPRRLAAALPPVPGTMFRSSSFNHCVRSVRLPRMVRDAGQVAGLGPYLPLATLVVPARLLAGLAPGRDGRRLRAPPTDIVRRVLLPRFDWRPRGRSPSRAPSVRSSCIGSSVRTTRHSPALLGARNRPDARLRDRVVARAAARRHGDDGPSVPLQQSLARAVARRPTT